MSQFKAELLITAGTPPKPRSQHSATIKGRYLVVFGGRSNEIYREEMKNVAFNDWHLLDLETREWCEIALFGEEMVESRWGHSMVTVGEKVVIFGGMNMKRYCEAVIHEVSFD